MSTRNGARTADVLGALGLPMPLSELRNRIWDAVIVGAGHNGLACASYLARAGLKTLVVECRERVGGACTIEETWPGYRISPCAYLLGLLHPLVIEELGLRELGLEWRPASSGMFVPFDDGASIQLWDDDEQCAREVKRLAPGDVFGWKEMVALKKRVRDALRPEGPEDVWIGAAPSRAEIEARIGRDPLAMKLLFEWSMVEFVERFLDDERLQCACLGQGVIGTNASPHDPGTASIHFHHNSGRLGGEPGGWGYVMGGMGMVSFLLCDRARALGAAVATGLRVARIVPGEGIELEGGDRLAAKAVVVNADPRATLKLLGAAADSEWKRRIEGVPIEGRTVKLNVALSELPNFTARPGLFEPHHLGQVNTPLSKTEWRDNHALANRGEPPPRFWCELYFQSAHDPGVAPPGKHTMSVFAQYAPYAFATGDWHSRRGEIEKLVVASIARYCSNLSQAIEAVSLLGPPDVEAKVGLTGGHIFQGECLPEFMWENRLTPRTPMPGVFLCGACTYPGGSVIGINGRNAAMEALKDFAP